MDCFHLFFCTGPTCSQQGAEESLHALQQGLRERGLDHRGVRLTLCRCLGQCGTGPNMVIYPEGTWYAQVDEKGAVEIVEKHLVGNGVVSRLLHQPLDPV